MRDHHSSKVIIPFGSEYLVLSHEQFEEARRRGRELMPPDIGSAPVPEPAEILDAGGMETRTGIPASWFLEQARRGTVPHLRAGKYVRFNLSEALNALRSRDGTRTSYPKGHEKGAPAQTVGRRRYPRATTSGSKRTDPRTLC